MQKVIILMITGLKINKKNLSQLKFLKKFEHT